MRGGAVCTIMAASVGAVEDTIREYLLYRGFVMTLKAFDQERKEDKDKGLRVQRVIDFIVSCIVKSDFVALQSFWSHMSKRFFSRLTHDLMGTAYRLETGVLRLFLVNAHRNSKHEEIKMFFDRMAPIIQDKRDWKDWFALPFTKNAEQHPTFKLYYTRDWYDSFLISLHNFFSTMFSALPLPTLLQFEQEHEKIQKFSTENALLHSQLATTKDSLSEAEHRVQKMEARLAQQVATQATATRSMSVGKSSKPSTPVRKSVTTAPSSTRTMGLTKIKKMLNTLPITPNSPPEVLDVPEQTQKEAETEEMVESFESEDVTPHATPTKHLTDLDQSSFDHGDGSKSIDSDEHIPFMVVEEQVYNDHNAPITHCQFSPNGIRAASVDTRGSLRVWEPTPYSIVTKARADYINTVLSMDWVHLGGSDSLLILGNNRGEMTVFDIANSKPLWEFQVDKAFPRIFSLACSPTSPLLAVAAAAGSAKPAPGGLPSGRSIQGLTSPSLPSQVNKSSEMTSIHKSSLSFDPIPGQLCLWDLNQQKLKSQLPVSPNLAINCMAFNHNSNLLVTGGVDGMIRLYDVVQEECLFGWTAHNGQVYNLQFSSDENTVFSIGDDGKFCQWSTLRSTEQVASYPIHMEACNPAANWSSSSFSYPSVPRGNLFAFESEDKYVLTCSLQEAIIYQLGEGKLNKLLGLFGHSGPVTCVDWVPGRRSYSTCVTGSVDRTVRVVNLLKGL